MIDEAGVDFVNLPSNSPDMPLGLGSGAGVIFGTTGGVAEAVVRRCMNSEKQYFSSDKVEMTALRGFDSVKEASVNVNGLDVKVAVVHGIANAQKLIDEVKAGNRFYHIIEVMACPGGCVGGAGQPTGTLKAKESRAEGLYANDKMSGIRSSDENPIIQSLYETTIGDQAHEMLHTHYSPRKK